MYDSFEVGLLQGNTRTKTMLPLHLILVRHGESEGNVANERSRKGDHRDFNENFLNRHSSHLRLTDRGREQAASAGKWLKENNFTNFDGYYVSEYVRAFETAALLDLPNAQWRLDFQLRERDHGRVDIVSSSVRNERFAEYVQMRKLHLFYAPWPDGESMAEVCDRLRNNIINTLHREMCEKKVTIVSHGDIMRAFRVILEGISADNYHALDRENPPEFKIGNGQIIHFTRLNPQNSKEVLPRLGWVRSVNPYDPNYAGHDWKPIVRKKYTNEELLFLANQTERILSE